jgi:outer membrane protein assembly factor BamB
MNFKGVIVAALVLSACGGGGSSGDQAPEPPPSPPPAPPPAPAAEPLPLGSQNWPMFGRDYAHQRSHADPVLDGTRLESLHVAHRIPGAGVSGTPAVADGVVYYADAAGWLNAVDAVDGGEVWRVRLLTAGSGMITASVFVTGDAVYVTGDAGASPTGAAGSGAHVWARDRATGAARWAVQIEQTPFSRLWGSPQVVGNTLIVGAASYQVWFAAEPMFHGAIVGLNRFTGEEIWRTSVCPADPEVPADACGGGVSVWSSVSLDTDLGLGFVGTGQAYAAPAGPYSDALVAFDYRTGERRWHYQFTADDIYWPGGSNAPTVNDRDIGASPNLFSAEIDGAPRQLVGVGDKGGRYIAFDRVTGELIWEQLLDPRSPPGSPIGGVMGTAAVGDGRIYVTNNTSTAGTQRGNARPGSAIAYALDTATGDVVWHTPLDAGVLSATSYSNALVWFVTWDGRLHVLDAGDGFPLQSVQLGTTPGTFDSAEEGFPNGSASGPAIANGRVYAGYGWTWGANVSGGLAIVASDQTPPPWRWTASCPAGFSPAPGLNTGFPTDAGARDFHVLPATTGTGPRPVFVALTGTVESEEQFLANSRIDELPAQGWTVIAPVRNCVTQGHSCSATPPPSMDGRTWEPWFDGAPAGNETYWRDEGPDVRFIVDAVRCTAAELDVDQHRIFVGGISAGGTLANRALTFRSDFFAGGVPASGEWYRVDGAGINEPVTDEIVEGRCCPRPLPEQLHHSINIVVWGGESDVWPTTGPPLGPTTRLAANYYASQAQVVTVACRGDHGHLWPRSSAFTGWVAETLASHPKGTPPGAFVLPETPPGFNCVMGRFPD